MSSSVRGFQILRDLSAGMVVFFVAVPLCLGIAHASNFPMISGLIAGVVGGIVVGAISGSSLSVAGPAAGLTAVVLSELRVLGSVEALCLAVILAGALQILMGLAKAGSFAAFLGADARAFRMARSGGGAA